MLRLIFPDDWQPERRWIADLVLGQFLGLQHETVFAPAGQARIEAAGRTLALADAFFCGERTPQGEARAWRVAASGLDARLCEPEVPVLFGSAGFEADAGGNAILSLDVLGSAFFMLSRYEEAVSAERDQHDRFPVQHSLAARRDFLERPIVDEYVEILWAAMRRVWPTLERKRRNARTLVSCDVDLPFDPACGSVARLGKRLLGCAWRERSPRAMVAAAANYLAVRRGDQQRDPYWHALFWMMDVNEQAGRQLTFNFIPVPTDGAMDNAPRVDDARLRALLRIIHCRGHLIGIHPGYNTYRYPEAFARSVATLRRVLEQERIGQDELGGRQHYLRWDAATTPRLWAEQALSYDSTLSYPTRAGFRTGTCHEYTMFDLAARRALNVRQRPLVVMENAVIDAVNMGLGHGEAALAAMQRFKRLCHQFDGDFTLLWHNSSFACDADRATYRALVA